MNDAAAAISNEECIAKFRDWSSPWNKNMTQEELDEQVSYISNLAALIAPTPLCKVTKAVMKDFYLESMMRNQSPESRRRTMLAQFALDAFVRDLRAERKRNKKGGRS